MGVPEAVIPDGGSGAGGRAATQSSTITPDGLSSAAEARVKGIGGHAWNRAVSPMHPVMPAPALPIFSQGPTALLQ